MNSLPNEMVKTRLIGCFAEALQHSIATHCRGEWLCTPSAIVPVAVMPASDAQVLAMGIRLRGVLCGEVRVELAENEASVLLSKSDGGSPDDLRRNWLELIKGTVNYLPKRQVDVVKLAFSVASYRMIDTAAEGIQIGRLELRERDGLSVMLHVMADDELLDSLEVSEPSAPQTSGRSENHSSNDSQLGRVIDVPLAVTLRFGQRTMRLREVLELNTGTLVELDRQVEEPVDLMLNERVIARGEVVIVDGNYGLRVTEIVERNPVLPH
jgi:flagellar motor switch protein FliN/FliY